VAFDQFQLLCAVRKGPWGVEVLNERIAQALQRRGLLEQDHGWYEGRPVLVTRNDYSLGLMNGDIGIALRLPEPPDSPGAIPRQVLRVVFPRNDGSGELRYILPSRLSSVETVFAMTVHKSQGSEFAHCALILPDVLNPVLTKELMYTGITRARHCFSLVESYVGVFEQTVQRRVERRSGLRKALVGLE
jgi:exodeoxyribonuclease V alpha subunit